MQFSVSRHALLVTVLAALLVAGGSVAVGAGDAGADPSPSVAGDERFAAQEFDADRVVLDVDVAADGTATWEIQYRLRLDTDEREEAFADLQSDLEEDPAEFRDRFRERMVSTAEAGERATGREMAIRNVTVAAETRTLPEQYGVLTYSFTWENFAVADGDELRIGDAIGGLFLEDGHRLIVSWPAEYELTDAQPTPDDEGDRSVRWIGPADFADDEPRVVVTRPGILSGVGWVVVAALALLVVLGVWRREDIGRALGRGDADTTDSETTSPETADHETGSASAGASETVPSEPDTGSDEPPEELLSNEERVLKLIRENGGRMKQQDVVQELGWTDARTSQVVSGLRDEGKLESFRLGRENVLRLPEADELAPDEVGDVDDDGA